MQTQVQTEATTTWSQKEMRKEAWTQCSMSNAWELGISLVPAAQKKSLPNKPLQKALKKWSAAHTQKQNSIIYSIQHATCMPPCYALPKAQWSCRCSPIQQTASAVLLWYWFQITDDWQWHIHQASSQGARQSPFKTHFAHRKNCT